MDVSDNPPESPEPILGEKPAISRPGAAVCVVIAIGAFAVGARAYFPAHGDVDVRPVQFGSADTATLLAEKTRRAFEADFGFILGYAVALTVTAFLAGRVFRTVEARRVAAVARPLAVVVVLADVLENVLVLRAIDRASSDPDVETLLDWVSALAVVKFTFGVPAAAIAVAALFVTVARLFLNNKWRLGGRPWVPVVPPDPLEGDPPALPPRDKNEGAARWRRGYRVPDIDLSAQSAGRPVVGFCLSGGGIRSGSVALGALQVLRAELLAARYLVSVSGGGYTAGALQLALTRRDGRTKRKRRRKGGRDERTLEESVLRDPDTTYMQGSVEEDRLRRNARYLAGSPAEIVVALGVVARVLVLSLAVLFGPAVVLGAALGSFYRVLPLAWSDIEPDGDLPVPEVSTGTWYALIVLGVLAASAHLASLFLFAYTRRPGTYVRRVANGVAGLALVVLLLGAGLPWLIYGADRLLDAGKTPLSVGGPVLGVVVSYVASLVSVLRRKKVFDSAGGLFKKRNGRAPVAAVPGGALQLLLIVVTLVLLAAAWLLLAAGVAARVLDGPTDTVGKVALGVLAGLLMLGGVLDQTTLSLHPFYRRKLAGAFAARRVQRSDRHLVAEGYHYAERTSLPDYAKRPERFPELVFAAAANLTGEKRAPLNASSFTFGARWIGGPDVGYVDTRALLDAVRPAFQRDLTVQAAVAVSGAAFASATGRSTRWYTTLLAVTGLRLGTWLPNPAFVERWNDAKRIDDWALPGLPMLRRLSYLVREVLGSHRWSDRLLQITDGGHYENLGLVETLRRRCTEIYCIDASGDRPPTAGTLEQAITLAYAELGVRIVLNDTVWNLVPGSGTPLEPTDPLAVLNKRLSTRAVVTATICYPPESGLPDGNRHGVLVIAKALLTPEMDYSLLSYAARNDVFPHDSTGDQFFDDEKLTAYSALGREIGTAAAGAMAQARAEQRSRRRTRCPLPDSPCARVKAVMGP